MRAVSLSSIAIVAIGQSGTRYGIGAVGAVDTPVRRDGDDDDKAVVEARLRTPADFDATGGVPEDLGHTTR
jgi:hypothetical protein